MCQVLKYVYSSSFFFATFFFVESVEMLITLISFIVLLPTVVPVFFVFLHLSLEVVLLLDTYASVFSIFIVVDVPAPVLNNL